MVEAIVAMSVIIVGLLGAFTLSSISVGLNRVVSDRYVAVNLANEGIELVKNLIDKNITTGDHVDWNAGFPVDGDYEADYDDNFSKSYNDIDFLCFDKNNGHYYYNSECTPSNSTTFKRKITIKSVSSDHVMVVSRVDWISRGSNFDFEVQGDFYNLKSFKKSVINSIGL